MILMQSTVPLKVGTTHFERNHSSVTLTQKSIQWFRLQINDPVRAMPLYTMRRKCEGFSKQFTFTQMQQTNSDKT